MNDMSPSSRQLGQAFDKLYSQKAEQNKATLDFYRRSYDLPELAHREDITENFYAYVRARNHFVILAVYNSYGEVMLQTLNADGFNWSLPGRSVRNDEGFFDAVDRVRDSIDPSLQICEVEPIAFVTNHFSFQSETIVHTGLAFIARSLNDSPLCSTSSCAILKVLELLDDRVSDFSLAKQKSEITETQSAEKQYHFHNKVMKRFFLTEARRRKEHQTQLISGFVGDATTVIDVAAGDSSLAEKIVSSNPSVAEFVANDINYSQLTKGSDATPGVLLTNHDAAFLPFRDKSFDAAICMNTLHHLPSPEHMSKVLSSIKRISQRALIWDVSDPKAAAPFPRLLNSLYYEWFLKDQAQAYLSDQLFKDIVSYTYHADTLKFGVFSSILGNFNYCMVEFLNE